MIASGSALLARSARLGKAEAQLRAAQYDPAIATLKQIVDQKDASLPAEAVLMELARAYRLAGKTEDARKTLHAGRRAARRLAVCDGSEGGTREAEGLDDLTIDVSG